MTPAPAEADADLFAPTAEIALFIGGGAFLTLLVIGFVTMLVISIVREERAAAAAKATTQDGDDR